VVLCAVCRDPFQEFEWAVLTLNHSGALAIKDNHVLVKQSINKYTTFFSQMFEPFLLGYWVSSTYRIRWGIAKCLHG